VARKTTRTRRNGGSSGRRTAVRKSKAIVRAVRTRENGHIRDVASLAEAVGARTKAQIAALTSFAQARAHGAFEGLEYQVRARPALAVGAAMGVGVVAGLLLARRH